MKTLFYINDKTTSSVDVAKMFNDSKSIVPLSFDKSCKIFALFCFFVERSVSYFNVNIKEAKYFTIEVKT